MDPEAVHAHAHGHWLCRKARHPYGIFRIWHEIGRVRAGSGGLVNHPGATDGADVLQDGPDVLKDGTDGPDVLKDGQDSQDSQDSQDVLQDIARLFGTSISEPHALGALTKRTEGGMTHAEMKLKYG